MYIEIVGVFCFKNYLFLQINAIDKMFSESAQEQILFDKIYQYLWVKSDTSSPPATLIPETVIMVRSQPIFWFFSDRETNEVRKKKRASVQKSIIKENWSRKVGKSGVVATLLHFCENLDLTNHKGYSSEGIKLTSQIQVVYFDIKSFEAFMDNNLVYLPFGILQRFVEPGDDRNSQIQALWSKQITLFSKRTNKRPLANRKMNLYERCCTFEGPEYFSDATQVKDFQSQRISDQINKMIQHLDAISYGKLNILQGTFYFKVDKDANCWFLFCGNLKFETPSKKVSHHQHHIQLGQIKIPSSIDNIISVYGSRPVDLEKDLLCIRCNKREKPANFKVVPYHYLIDAKECSTYVPKPEQWPEEVRKSTCKVKISAKDRDNSQGVEAYLNTVTQMPIMLELVHNKLTPASYEVMKDDFDFQQKQIRVCMMCYFELVGIQEQSHVAKVRDNLDYFAFMQRQGAKPQTIPARLQFLNARRFHAKHDFVPTKPTAKKELSRHSLQQYIEARSAEIREPLMTPVDSTKQLLARQLSTADHKTRKTKSDFFNSEPSLIKQKFRPSQLLSKVLSQEVRQSSNPYIRYNQDIALRYQK